MKQQAQTKILIGIGAITAAAIVGYFSLDYFSSKKPAAETALAAATAEEPGNETSAAADQSSDAGSATEAATSNPTADGAKGDYSAAVASAAESAGAGTSLTAEEATRIGQEVARQVATQVAQAIVDQKMAASGSASSGLSEADARRIGAEEGRRVAKEVASATIQQALAGNGSTHAQKQAGDTAESAASGKSKSRLGNRHAAASAKALQAWWTAPAEGEFGLLYAGQPKGETAIALLFSEQPAESALSQSIKVYTGKGKPVSGAWEAATNPRLVVLRGLKPGRYTVVIDPSLANATGKTIDKAQHGSLHIR